MKIVVDNFRGELPSIGNTKLPPGYASSAVNSRTVTGDLSAFYDIGKPFQLAKTAPIAAEYYIKDKWLQYSSSENTYGSGIDITPGTIPGDTTYRTFISGTESGLRQTNYYYATDSSQQGGNPLGAYPYVTFPVGIANPTSAPTASTGSPSNPSTTYEYAQQYSLNNAITATGGTGYTINDVLTLVGGTVSTGLYAATLTVTNVDATTGAVTGISLTTSGFYSVAPSATVSVTGGSGSGATFTATYNSLNFSGLSPQTPDNGAGAYVNWTISGGYFNVSAGQLPFGVAYTSSQLSLKTATEFSASVDFNTADNGYGYTADAVYWLSGTPAIASYGGQFLALTGAAVVASKQTGTFYIGSTAQESGNTTSFSEILATTSVSLSDGVDYRIKIVGTQQTSGTVPGFSVTANLYAVSDLATSLATVTSFVPYSGDQVGIGMGRQESNQDHGVGVNLRNLYVSVTQPASSYTSESTAYVYTYVSQYGSGANLIEQESGPSLASDTLTVYINTSTNPATLNPVTVVIPAAPSGQDITNYNLYRLVLQTDGSEEYQFIAQVASSTSAAVTYTDTTLDKNLGAVLSTADYSPPPSNLEGIVALPNGVMAGFFDNTLALSAQNFPFAWPVGNQYSTDTNIVGIAPIDTTVFIITTAHPYTAFGSDPSNYTMSKETSVQGCVSKRSIATHKRAGVLYASGNGLCYYRGQGDLDLLRGPNGEPFFTYEEWQALNPSSIIGIVHDDYYYWWYDATSLGGKKAGYMLDIPSLFGYGDKSVRDGFGLIELDYHITSVYNEPQADNLFFTPDKSVYAINGSVVTASSNVLSQWEGNSSAYRTQVWQRNEFLLPRDATFMLAQIDANDFNDITLEISSETGVAFNGAVTNANPFIISPQPGKRWNIKITGTSVVNVVSMYENSAEISPQ